ncbi:hypothetical protein [Paenibacillus ferrarius]|nr:hypothetical protein [Paenibacillus ferrarius]
MYRLEQMEGNRWMRWQIRLIAMGVAVSVVYHGSKWLYQAICGLLG